MTVSVTLRAIKGVPLTNAEMDANFSALAAGVNAANASTTVPSTTSTIGGVIVGTGLSVTLGGILSLNTATTSSIGGIKVGPGLYADGSGTLSVTSATASLIGGIKVGSGLVIDGSGVLSTATIAAAIASSTVLGGVKVGSGLSVDSSGLLSTLYPIATTTTLGSIKVGSGLSVDSSGNTTIAGLHILASVNFGTTGAIRKSFNIASVSRVTAGKFIITFTTPMPDANYLVIGSLGNDWDSGPLNGNNNVLSYGNSDASYSSGKTTSSVVIQSVDTVNYGTEDTSSISVLIVG